MHKCMTLQETETFEWSNSLRAAVEEVTGFTYHFGVRGEQ